MSKATTETLEKVSGEFEAEALRDIESGRQEAALRIDLAKKETIEAVAKILETSIKQAEAVKRQIIGAAELEARNSQLKSLERAVNEVFDLATKEISKSSHAKSLAKLIEEGVEAIGPKAKVQCSAKDEKAVAAAIHKLNDSHTKLVLDEKPIDTIGGVMLSTSDGIVRFDNTIEARLERMRPMLRKEVAGLLTAS